MGELTDLYEKLIKDGKHTVENILKLMGNAGIVLDNKRPETISKVNEAANHVKVELTKFEDILKNIMKEKMQKAKKEENKEKSHPESVDDAFKKLEAAGKNNADTIMLWLKDAKVVLEENAKTAARNLQEATEKGAVEITKFKEVLLKIAEEKKQKVEDVTVQLMQTNAHFWESLFGSTSEAKPTIAGADEKNVEKKKSEVKMRVN